MKEFKLNGQEYIELNKLLKLLGWVDTGGDAKIRTLQGEVIVNGEVETRIRKKLRIGDVVQFMDMKLVMKE